MIHKTLEFKHPKEFECVKDGDCAGHELTATVYESGAIIINLDESPENDVQATVFYAEAFMADKIHKVLGEALQASYNAKPFFEQKAEVDAINELIPVEVKDANI